MRNSPSLKSSLSSDMVSALFVLSNPAQPLPIVDIPWVYGEYPGGIGMTDHLSWTKAGYQSCHVLESVFSRANIYSQLVFLLPHQFDMILTAVDQMCIEPPTRWMCPPNFRSTICSSLCSDYFSLTFSDSSADTPSLRSGLRSS
jgi:hypothetical protein